MKIRTTKLPVNCKTKGMSEGYVIAIKMIKSDINRYVWYTYDLAVTESQAMEAVEMAKISTFSRRGVAVYKFKGVQ